MTKVYSNKSSVQDIEMTPQRYARLHDIFLKVLDLPISELLIVIDRVCKNNSQLRNQVKELLAIDKAISNIEKPVGLY